MAQFFKRVEKKYMLSTEQYNEIIELIKEKTKEDEHGISTICNIYFDSPDFILIRHSIEKPEYKDKIRIRSYNVPDEETPIFLEVKRKVSGVVSKRRIKCTLKELKNYVKEETERKDISCDRQVSNEIQYYFKFYNLEPKVYISYNRRAYYSKENQEFRITFDSNIITRTNDLDLQKGVYGEKILEDGKYIMEVKTLGAVPLWFVEIISKLKLKPCTYSKYGEAYTKIIMKNRRIMDYV